MTRKQTTFRNFKGKAKRHGVQGVGTFRTAVVHWQDFNVFFQGDLQPHDNEAFDTGTPPRMRGLKRPILYRPSCLALKPSQRFESSNWMVITASSKVTFRGLGVQKNNQRRVLVCLFASPDNHPSASCQTLTSSLAVFIQHEGDKLRTLYNQHCSPETISGLSLDGP